METELRQSEITRALIRVGSSALSVIELRAGNGHGFAYAADDAIAAMTSSRERTLKQS
jgi:hypothetical protein